MCSGELVCANKLHQVLKRTDPRKFRYVYTLEEENKNEIFYVGETCDLRNRLSSHTSAANKPHTPATRGVSFIRELMQIRNVNYLMRIAQIIPVLNGENGSRKTDASKAAELKTIFDLYHAGHPIANQQLDKLKCLSKKH